MARYLGIDLGATTVGAVVGDETGAVLGRASRATPQGPTGAAVTEAVLGVAGAACTNAGVDPGGIRAAGVGAIGPLDRAAGAVERPANLPGIERIPLVEPLAALFDAPVHLRNDATAGVVGERLLGDAPDDVVYLTVSSGIGAGVAVDGHVLSGRDGNAGEVGHVVVDPEGRMRCGCGRDGHWEAYCSGENLPRYATDRHDGAPTALAVEDPALTAADVYALAGADDFVDRLLDRVGRWNAVGVSTLVHAFAPREIRVGGAVALENPDAVLDPVRDRLPDLVAPAVTVPEVDTTPLGADAVVLGALATAIDADRDGSDGHDDRNGRDG